MVPPLQARYLDIEWQERGRARAVTVAPEPIEIEPGPEGTWVAETQVFNGLCPWVGLRLDGALAHIRPAFEGPQGEFQPMLQIDDGRGGHWWVQDDGWDEAKKRHLSELQRGMGRFTIVVGSQRLYLDNIVDGLGRAEVEDYLRDFQQDLIWLVMGFGGATGTMGSALGASQELVKSLEAFVAAARRVLANPARQVREIQVEGNAARLRPNGATFRQYARNPHAQRLPGRGAVETPDIADNRYLRHMVQACDQLAALAGRAADRHMRSFLERARVEAERGESYEGMTHRRVDPQVFDRQMAELEEKLARVAHFRHEGSHAGKAVREWAFRPGAPYGSRTDQMFYDHKDGSRASDDALGVQFSVLQVPEELATAIRATQGFCDYFAMDGTARATIKQTRQGKSYREVAFNRIDGVTPFSSAIAHKQGRRAQLEQDDWLAPLTSKERQEMRQEAHTARARGRVYQAHGQWAQQAAAALAQCQAELRAQDAGWHGLGVATSPVVPMGVRFSQSPDYAACLAAFGRVTSLVQGSGLGADALEAIERMGLLHASALYERWCLVKIIAVLMEDFQFQPQRGWQDRLVQAVTGKPQSVTLEFDRADLGLTACLEVQPELANGRRPDFRLRMLWQDRASSSGPSDDAPWDAPALDDGHPGARHEGLVMDAKFRTQWRYGELGRTLRSLVEVKDYGQEGDRVFILHPAPASILRPTSPLGWGRDCDYGQEPHVAHRRGVVFLAPGGGEANPEANLRRLIVLLLQATFQAPFEDANEVWQSDSFCIRCGRKHEPGDVQQHITRSGNLAWTIACAGCGMHVTRTHCFGCKEGVLFKNGLQLTYHRTVADQVTNVVCPCCGSYFDSDVHGARSHRGRAPFNNARDQS